MAIQILCAVRHSMFIALAVTAYQNAGVKAISSFHSREITKTASKAMNLPRPATSLIQYGQPGRHVLSILVLFKITVITVRLQLFAGLESNRLA
jgi:hypothetical protein